MQIIKYIFIGYGILWVISIIGLIIQSFIELCQNNWEHSGIDDVKHLNQYRNEFVKMTGNDDIIITDFQNYNNE